MKPLWYRSQFSTLKVGSNIQRHAKVESTVGTMNGRSMEARTMRLPRKLRFRSRASHMPSVNLKIVAQNVYTNVFWKAVWKIESFQALTKFLTPTNSPMLPTLVLESDSHTPITKGYAMNRPSRSTVGDSRAKARRRSFSRTRPPVRGRIARGRGSATSRPAAPFDPPAIGAAGLEVAL